MNDVRKLAQEEFTRLLRQEMFGCKWALDVGPSSGLHMLSRIHCCCRAMSSELESTPVYPPDDPQNPEGVPAGGLEGEEGEPDELGESTDEEGEDEDEDEVDHKPQRHVRHQI